MNVQTNKPTQGFTIIEVVLVLAIAGLIFLMVFIALPALQRSQRDTQRKSDLSRAVTQLTNYQSANRNNLPGEDDWNTFRDNYLLVGGDTFADPSQGDYEFDYRDDNKAPTELSNKIYVYGSATCQGESIEPAGSRKVAFAMKLEGGGVACANN